MKAGESGIHNWGLASSGLASFSFIPMNPIPPPMRYQYSRTSDHDYLPTLKLTALMWSEKV